MAAVNNIDVQYLQQHNNANITLEELAAVNNIEVRQLLDRMRELQFFVWNNRRAHGDEGLKIYFKVYLPPYRGPVLRMYNDSDTFQQVMVQLAQDVGMPFGEWIASYNRLGQDVNDEYLSDDTDWDVNDPLEYLSNDKDWDDATLHMFGLRKAIQLGRTTMTIHLINNMTVVARVADGDDSDHPKRKAGRPSGSRNHPRVPAPLPPSPRARKPPRDRGPGSSDPGPSNRRRERSPDDPAPDAPAKRGRGRPRGSRNVWL